jgi:hypothetical protein
LRKPPKNSPKRRESHVAHPMSPSSCSQASRVPSQPFERQHYCQNDKRILTPFNGLLSFP